MQADTILKNAQLKADGIIEQARRKANTMEEHLESVKYRKKLMHVESVINSDPKLIDAYKTAEKRLAEQKPTRSLSGHGTADEIRPLTYYMSNFDKILQTK